VKRKQYKNKNYYGQKEQNRELLHTENENKTCGQTTQH